MIFTQSVASTRSPYSPPRTFSVHTYSICYVAHSGGPDRNCSAFLSFPTGTSHSFFINFTYFLVFKKVVFCSPVFPFLLIPLSYKSHFSEVLNQSGYKCTCLIHHIYQKVLQASHNVVLHLLASLSQQFK